MCVRGGGPVTPAEYVRRGPASRQCRGLSEEGHPRPLQGLLLGCAACVCSSLSTAGPMWPEGRRKWPAVLALGSPWAKSKSQWQGRRLALPLPDAAAERGSRSPPPTSPTPQAKTRPPWQSWPHGSHSDIRGQLRMWPHGWVIQTGSRAQQYGLSSHGQAHGGARATAAWSHAYPKGHGRKRTVTLGFQGGGCCPRPVCTSSRS